MFSAAPVMSIMNLSLKIYIFNNIKISLQKIKNFKNKKIKFSKQLTICKKWNNNRNKLLNQR